MVRAPWGLSGATTHCTRPVPRFSLRSPTVEQEKLRLLLQGPYCRHWIACIRPIVLFNGLSPLVCAGLRIKRLLIFLQSKGTPRVSLEPHLNSRQSFHPRHKDSSQTKPIYSQSSRLRIPRPSAVCGSASRCSLRSFPRFYSCLLRLAFQNVSLR